MSIVPSTLTPHLPVGKTRHGFDIAREVAAAQRVSLGRGLAFTLLLAIMWLATAYIPMVMDGPDRFDGPTWSARVR